MIRALLALLAFLAGSLMAAPAGAAPTVLGDNTWYSEGSVLPYADGWCREFDKSLVPGKTYSNRVIFEKGKLPAVTFEWRFPEQPSRNPNCGVGGMDRLGWGNFAGGWVLDPVTPKQVAWIKELSISYSTRYNAPPENGGVLLETFLTRLPYDSEPKRAAIEIGNFLHSPAATRQFFDRSPQLGIFTDRYGVAWRAAINPSGATGKFVMFMPADGKDRLTGTIDLLGEINFLRAHGSKVMPYWLFTGFGLGVETHKGTGRFSIDRMVVTYR